MNIFFVILFCSLAFSLGFCLSGLLTSSEALEEDVFAVRNMASSFSNGYNAGLEDGRAQVHADYAAKQRDQRGAK